MKRITLATSIGLAFFLATVSPARVGLLAGPAQNPPSQSSAQPLFRPLRERDFRIAISLLLLDLYIGEFESCRIWIGGVPKLGC